LFLTPELAPLVAYDPEYVTNYELGFKGTFSDGRVVLNTDVFWMDYTDKQKSILLDNSDGRYGPDPNIELELRTSPWDGAFITVDAGYLINEYNSFLVADPANPGEFIDRSQQNINDRTPDWALNASVGHSFVMGSGAQLTTTLGVYAQGG